MTLVELTVTMAILLIVMGAFLSLFGAFSSSASNSRTLTAGQENAHTTLRILQADLRSADPLLLVPSSFTLDPSGSSAVGANGTSGVDVVAMYETVDTYNPCSTATTTTTTTTTLPSPFLSSAFAPNVIWAYSPAAGTLTRYSLCSATWTPVVSLSNLANPTQPMFQVAQDGSSASSPQTTTTSVTTVPNQAAPSCGSSIAVYFKVKAQAQATAFTVRLNVPLPNQTGVVSQAC